MKRFASLIAVALLGASPKANAAPPPRMTPAAAAARDYLSVFNQGDSAAYKSFIHQHWPASGETSSDFIEKRAQSGGYDTVAVVRSSDTFEVEIVKARLADDYLRLELEVGPEPDRSIQKLTLTPADRPADIAPPRRIAARAVGALVDKQLAATGDFSGAVLIAENGRVVYSRAEGLADRERNIPNTTETRFRMASMGKMFTGVAILQLAQAGKVDLNATVGTYLKDYPNATFAGAVTIQQLLTHTGGAGDFMSQKWADNYQRLKAPQDYIDLFGARPPEFSPGARFSYANYGYIVLGRIIEVASGQSYEDYVRDHIFRVAGMTRTGLNAAPDRPSVLAIPYVKTADGYGPPPAPFSGPAMPAGGAYSTVGDMLAFANALTRHQLLDVAHARLLTTGTVKSDSGQYADGFEDHSAGGIRDVGHDGGGPGQNGGFRILDDGRAVVVVLSNVAPTWRADALCAFVAARLEV